MIKPWTIAQDDAGPCNGDLIIKDGAGRLVALIYRGFGKHGEEVAKSRAERFVAAVEQGWCSTCGDDTADQARECPTCSHSGGPVVGVYGGHARVRSAKHGGRRTRDAWPDGHKPVAAAAMGIDWATLAEMSEAIPPAYTRFIGQHLIQHIAAQRKAA